MFCDSHKMFFFLHFKLQKDFNSLKSRQAKHDDSGQEHTFHSGLTDGAIKLFLLLTSTVTVKR